MDVKEAIQTRRSVRRYAKGAIPKGLLEDVLEAARLSPSSNNLQRWNIIVVTDEETRHRLVPVSGNQSFVGECSTYLVGVTDHEQISAIDISIAFDHISLRAVELGLGTCWIGDFEPERVKEILGIPKELDVPICMTLGYPSSAPEMSDRKELSALFFRDRWGRKWP